MYAQRIKQIRTELNLSVSKLSKKINIPERTIVSYESEGRTPSIDFLAQLCKELNINPNWFLFGEGEIFNNSKSSLLQNCIEDMILQTLRKNGIIQ